MYGVPPHELGHYIDDMMSTRSDSFSRHMHMTSKEKPITSYAPNSSEWFAEMFRLFVTNPMLLKEIRPETFRLLRKEFKPTDIYPAEALLTYFAAPPTVFTRLEGYRERAQKMIQKPKPHSLFD